MLLLPLDCRQELEVLLVLNLLVQPLAMGLHLLQVVLVTHVVQGLVVDLLRQDVQVLVLSQALGIACNILQIYISWDRVQPTITAISSPAPRSAGIALLVCGIGQRSGLSGPLGVSVTEAVVSRCPLVC